VRTACRRTASSHSSACVDVSTEYLTKLLLIHFTHGSSFAAPNITGEKSRMTSTPSSSPSPKTIAHTPNVMSIYCVHERHMPKHGCTSAATPCCGECGILSLSSATYSCFPIQISQYFSPWYSLLIDLRHSLNGVVEQSLTREPENNLFSCFAPLAASGQPSRAYHSLKPKSVRSGSISHVHPVMQPRQDVNHGPQDRRMYNAFAPQMNEQTSVSEPPRAPGQGAKSLS